MTTFDRYFPWIVVGLSTLAFLVMMVPPGSAEGELDLHEFGKLPIQVGGRVMPIDSFARNSLLIISHQQTYKETDNKSRSTKKISATRWMLEVMASTFVAERRPRFTVPVQTARLIGLQPKETNVYSYVEVAGPLRQFVKILLTRYRDDEKGLKEFLDKQPQGTAALFDSFRTFDIVGRFVTDHKIFRIDNMDVQKTLGLKRREGSRYAFSEFVSHYDILVEQARAAREAKQTQVRPNSDQERKLDTYQTHILSLADKVQRYLSIGGFEEHLTLIPPSAAQTTEWIALSEARHRFGPGTPQYKAAGEFMKMVGYFYGVEMFGDEHAKQNPEERAELIGSFGKGLDEYRNQLDKHPTYTQKEKVRLEYYFNYVEPFSACLYFYVLIFLLAACSWIGWSEPLQRASFWTLCVVFTIHTLALIARMHIMGRPPVTNLYSSAIFIGWGCVLIGIVMEKLYPLAISTAVGALIGFGTMIIALHLGKSGDTMEVMRAVLDTNFWLATHVTIVTFGYVATAFAGGIGAFYILAGVCIPSLDAKVGTVLTRMTYGVLCFATLLSFVGTVLGGIWADQSWGRFWGWDPKENGAVLIVIWNALILHARWAGMIKARGIAVLSVFGMMVVGWSWFGTNQLGIGLHAYGFNNTLAVGLTVFWGSQLVIMGLGLLPMHYWRSFGPNSAKA